LGLNFLPLLNGFLPRYLAVATVESQRIDSQQSTGRDGKQEESAHGIKGTC
jgi:hypothetical protein